MARRARTLAVWINGIHAAQWTLSAGGDELAYDPAWRADPRGRPLSLSLPFNLDNLPLRGERVRHYFDNLLPDSESIRRRIQAKYRTASQDSFDLLAAVGRDCVGAVQLLPVGEAPGRSDAVECEPLTDGELEGALAQLAAPGLPLAPEEDDLRVSLAGAQEKTAFLRHEGRWCRPRGATPTTHIFKLPIGLVGGIQADMSGSVENEWLCSRLLHHYGLPVARCEIGRFGARKVLVVERFDRRWSGTHWLRLVQEDFCQVHGLPSSLKYERDGGPGILELARVLATSDRRDLDLAVLLKAQILFWMLAAGDGHAKNFSVHLLPGGRFHLAPLYDVLSFWPIIGAGPGRIAWHKARLAMALRGANKHYLLSEIQRRHFNATAARIGLGEAEESIRDLVTRTGYAIAEVQKELPRGFPDGVLTPILEGLRRSADALAAMPAA